MAWLALTATKQLTLDDYTVAWICALPHEKAAACNMLDELHHSPPQPAQDKNVYTFGSMRGHNVVIVCQGDMGTEAAAVVAARLDMTFHRLRFGLLVGIAGGVPDRIDVRLGDVVVSRADGLSGGVVAHSHGRVTPMGFEVSRSFVNGVPEVLRNAINELEAQLLGRENEIPASIEAAVERNPWFEQFCRPDLVDYLFKSECTHVDRTDSTCQGCEKDGVHLVPRQPRSNNGPFVHFGVVASGNQVIKSSTERRRIADSHPGVLSIEMEAAGLMNVLGCAAVRGICDYADCHKNDDWQFYAAATAAACAREILGIVPTVEVQIMRSISHSDEEKNILLCLYASHYGSCLCLVP